MIYIVGLTKNYLTIPFTNASQFFNPTIYFIDSNIITIIILILMSKTYQGETTNISMSKKNAKDSAYGQDSLRFSYEFDRQSTASSADDK